MREDKNIHSSQQQFWCAFSLLELINRMLRHSVSSNRRERNMRIAQKTSAMARMTKTEQKLGLFQEKVSLIFSSQICWPLQINLAKAIFPQSLDYESKLHPKFKQPASLPLPLPPTDWVADVSKCVINAMAGLISEILLSNYIQMFISQAQSVMVAQQVGPAGRRPLVVKKNNCCVDHLIIVCVCVNLLIGRFPVFHR